MEHRNWDSPIATGMFVGAAIGCFFWFLLALAGLPKLLIYLSGIWAVEPILKWLGLHGEINLLIPALLVSVVSFTVYGLILGAVIERYSSVDENDSHWK